MPVRSQRSAPGGILTLFALLTLSLVCLHNLRDFYNSFFGLSVTVSKETGRPTEGRDLLPGFGAFVVKDGEVWEDDKYFRWTFQQVSFGRRDIDR